VKRSSKIVGVILAAGQSSRLGHPKQLVLYRGQSLIENTAEALAKISLIDFRIILGAYASEIAAALPSHEDKLLLNKDWAKGVSTSIILGVQFAIDSQADALLITLSDQPKVDEAILAQLCNQYQVGTSQVVICNYGVEIGPPVIFDQSCFHDLLQLKGDTGAKKILQSSKFSVDTYPFADGLWDVDTVADLP
jgi:molybdenum cofactor cytidylyltransferase